MTPMHRMNPERVLELKQLETQRRLRCRECKHLPAKVDHGWIDTDARCNAPRLYLIGRKNCPGKKGSA